MSGITPWGVIVYFFLFLLKTTFFLVLFLSPTDSYTFETDVNKLVSVLRLPWKRDIDG